MSTDIPQRWSKRRKMEVVMRLFRGESLGVVSLDRAYPTQERPSGHPGFSSAGALKRFWPEFLAMAMSE